MKSTEFELQHSTTPQPKLHDGECATRDWPMPTGGVWVPRPAAEEFERLEHPDVVRMRKVWAKDEEFFAGIQLPEQPRLPTKVAIPEQHRLEELRVRLMHHDPAEELNPIAAAFTRLMTWGQR